MPTRMAKFTVLPMGFCNSSFILSSQMNKIFRDMLDDNIETYYEDILLHSSDIESHKILLEIVVNRLKEWGLTLSTLKLTLFQTRIKFVGYEFGNGTTFIDPARVEAILSLAPPKNKRWLARVCGVIQYYRKFLPEIANLMYQLNNLQSEKRNFKWTAIELQIIWRKGLWNMSIWRYPRRLNHL